MTVAVWWAIFSVPLLVAVPEPAGGRRLSLAQAARAGFGQVAHTVRDIRRMPAIMLFLAAYVGVTLMGARIDLMPYSLFGFRISKFYLITTLIAMFQGGTQALSRAFYARLIPAGRAAEFFRVYNMMGKFAAIGGPLLMGAVARATGNPRAGMLAITGLFIAGAVLLWRVPSAPPAPIAGQGAVSAARRRG